MAGAWLGPGRIVALLVLCLLPRSCDGFTRNAEVQRLYALRQALMDREIGSEHISSWSCSASALADRTCDPCGPESGGSSSWGTWAHIACRGAPERDRNGDGGDGVVTNIHLTDLRTTGTLAMFGDALCQFRSLRELDLDGGALYGPIPPWLATCFPFLEELDLSFNQLEGPIPAELGLSPNLQSSLLQLKLQSNRLSDAVPPSVGLLARLRVLWLHDNDLSGPLPPTLANLNDLISCNVQNNADLCGPLPPGLEVDWDRQQEMRESGTEPHDWMNLCSEKMACGIMYEGGTQIGQWACPLDISGPTGAVVARGPGGGGMTGRGVGGIDMPSVPNPLDLMDAMGRGAETVLETVLDLPGGRRRAER